MGNVVALPLCSVIWFAVTWIIRHQDTIKNQHASLLNIQVVGAWVRARVSRCDAVCKSFLRTTREHRARSHHGWGQTWPPSPAACGDPAQAISPGFPPRHRRELHLHPEQRTNPPQLYPSLFQGRQRNTDYVPCLPRYTKDKAGFPFDCSN